MTVRFARPPDRMGIRYIVTGLLARGSDAELIEAKTIGLPVLDRRYKEHAPGSAPVASRRSRAQKAPPY